MTGDDRWGSGRRRAVASLVALVLVVAGCSTDGGGADGGSTATTEPAGGGSSPGGVAGSGGGIIGLLAACPSGDSVEDPPESQERTTAVAVDVPDVVGIGDRALPDLGDPRIDVTAYDLSLSVAPATARIEAGVARLAVDVVEATDELQLDLVGLDVSSVSVDGAPVEARREAHKLIVPLGDGVEVGGTVAVTVCYSGTPAGIPSPAIYNAPVGWNRSSGGSFVLAEPEGARSWYPVNEHPTDKASYRFTITVPAGTTAVANGRLVRGPVACTGDVPAGTEVGAGEDQRCDEPDQVPSDAATSTFVWEMPAPMAPYLATVVVGDLRRRALPPVDGVPVEIWLPEDVSAAGADALATSAAALDFLVDVFGPYPFESYGGVIVPGGADEEFLDNVALETQSLVIYGQDSALAPVVVHETAHQWIGDSVSVVSWADDLWYVEGFATYAEWLWVEQAAGREEYDGFVADAEFSIRAEVDPIGDLSPDALFTPLPYQGGALVFHALRVEMGDDAFFEFLRLFVDRYRYANASTDDLVATASEVAGRDLSPLVGSWLGPPSGRPDLPG